MIVILQLTLCFTEKNNYDESSKQLATVFLLI